MSKKPNTPESEKVACMVARMDRIKTARVCIADAMLTVMEAMQILKDAKEDLARAQQRLLDYIDDDGPRLPYADDDAADGSGPATIRKRDGNTLSAECGDVKIVGHMKVKPCPSNHR